MSSSTLSRLVQPCLNCTDRRQVTVRAALFFDGTLNNRENVAAGIDHENGGEDTSYDNGYSNIAKLDWLNIPRVNYDFYFKIYIEGAGTEDLEDDSSIGYYIGVGGCGVIQKCKDEMDRLKKGFTEKINDDIVIKNIHIDIFGFSRGRRQLDTFLIT